MEMGALDSIIGDATDGIDSLGEGEGAEGEGEGGEGEGEGEMTEEQREQLREEANNTKAAVDEMKAKLDEIKDLLAPKKEALWKTVGKFVGSTAASAIIFTGVSYGLQKAIASINAKGGDSSGDQKKLAVIKALSSLSTSLNDIAKGVSKWLHDHSDDKVTLEGIDIALTSVMEQYMNAITKAGTETLDEVQNLMTKDANGKTTFSTPTLDDISRILPAIEAFIKALGDLANFQASRKAEMPVLATMPLTEGNVDDLKKQLKTIQNMSY